MCTCVLLHIVKFDFEQNTYDKKQTINRYLIVALISVTKRMTI